MRRIRRLLLLAIVLLWFHPVFAVAGPVWTDYIGANVFKDERVSWARTLRGIGRDGTGVRAELDTEQFAALENQVRSLSRSFDLIIPVGGLGAAKKPADVRAFMSVLEQDGGARWKQVIEAQAVRLAAVTDPNHRVYWQIGNEINSVNFTENLAPWTAAGRLPEGDVTPNDASTIPVYVEYFLAPTVEGLRAARDKAGSSKDRFAILLGPIANIARADSQEWLAQLLEYQVQGRFAPSLKGSKVHQLVDIAAIHYLFTQSFTHRRVAGDEILTRLFEAWVRSGRLQGLWLTEEVGRKSAERNEGGATAVSVVASFLAWAERHNVTPAQARVSFWGWWLGNPKTSAGRMMELLHGFLGDVPLRVRVTDSGQESANVKVISLASAAGPKKTVTVLESLRDRAAIEVVPVLDDRSWGSGSAAVCYVVGQDNLARLDCAVDASAHPVSVKIRNGLPLQANEVGLILLEEKP